MSETSINKALMRRMYEEMWNRGDPSAARIFFAKPTGVERFVGEFLQAFPDLQHTVEESLAEGDQIAIRFSAQGAHWGMWKGVAPSGRRIHYSGLTLARIVDGKIVEHHTWWDALELMEQISAGQS